MMMKGYKTTLDCKDCKIPAIFYNWIIDGLIAVNTQM